MNETEFWEIVASIGWPNRHYDDAKRWFMEHCDRDAADRFRAMYGEKRKALNAAANSGYVCDSWDDTLAHTIGLGRDEYERCLAEPHRLIERERTGDYRESFSYCIPYDDDYDLLTDAGYVRSFPHLEQLIARLEGVDPDDVPPKEYRRYPGIIAVCRLLLEKRWTDSVGEYHRQFGDGYADTWPIGNYLVPNMIQSLERFRLRS